MAKQPVSGNGNTAQSSVVPHVSSKAMQKDLGPQIVAMFAGAEDMKAEVERLREEIGHKNYAAIAKLTLGVYTVAKNDPNVHLATHFGQDGQAKQWLNEALYLALGMKEIIQVEGAEKVVWAKSCGKYLPQYGEATNTPEYERKNTFRTNLSKQLNKAIGAALDMHKRKIVPKEENGTLVIAGPEVKKQFGVESVALNEKINQGIPGTDGNPTKLLEKPSFTALYNNAAKSEGLAVKSKSNDRTSKVMADPNAAIVQMGELLLNALKRLDPDKLTRPAEEMLTKISVEISNIL